VVKETVPAEVSLEVDELDERVVPRKVGQSSTLIIMNALGSASVVQHPPKHHLLSSEQIGIHQPRREISFDEDWIRLLELCVQ